MWPDPFFTADDPSTRTGQRLDTNPAVNLTLPDSAAPFRKLFDDLSLLDGFGTTSSLFVRAGVPVDPKTVPADIPSSADPKSSVLLVDLEASPPQPVAFELELVAEFESDDAPSTLVISPARPLAPMHRYGLVVTRRVRGVDGRALAPSPAMQQVLSGSATGALARGAAGVPDLVAALRTLGAAHGTSELAAVSVFTTQHTVDDSMAIASDIRKRSFTYQSLGACTLDPMTSLYRICEGSFVAGDYRRDLLYVEDGVSTPRLTHAIPVTVYLPATGAGPFPTIIYGHGLNGTRHQAAKLAELSAPSGFATVAIDAPKHGDHPDKAMLASALGTVTEFFGFTIAGMQSLDSRKLRDNFRQATYDKLQLVEMLRRGVDADGDGVAEVGVDRLMYLGVSLGGLMTPEFLSLVPEVKVAVPIVPGARISEIIQDGAQFRAIILLFRASASDGDVARFFPLLQTAIDAGDAGAYAPHILADRLPGFDTGRPQLLMQMVIDDDTVPNSTNRYFARALDVPLVGDELQPIGLPARATGMPVRANMDTDHTAGVFQYDLVWQKDSMQTEPATHNNVAANPIAITQTLHFVNTWIASGVAEIIDPYRTLGVKP
jgi:dienelactone hydrolase